MPADLIVSPTEFKHGLACIACDREIPPGQGYSKRLLGVIQWCPPGEGGCEARPIVELVCVPCGMGLEREESEAASG